MNVAIVGSGNVATVFGRLIKNAGHTIVAVAGRNEMNTKQLAATLNSNCFYDVSLMPAADIYIIAVSDGAIKDVCEALKVENKIVVHTSGAVSKYLLENSSGSFGVLYPLQSLRKENENNPVIPLLIDANNESTLNVIKSFALTFSSKVFVAGDEQRMKLHVAAVIVSNFTNYIYTLTKDFCESENVPFKMLIPLIEETATRLEKFNPEDVQTGPAIRNDISTINKHLEILQDYPQLHQIYQSMSEGIANFYRIGEAKK